VITTRAALLEALKKYDGFDATERGFVSEFVKLLEHADAYQRTHLPGHLTGSAWILDETKQFVLLTHHAKLNKWLQPGGHTDGDEDITAVASREVQEETGLTSFELLDPLFDIDIHTIPSRNDFPEHLHFDVRALLQASKNHLLMVTEESHDLAWIPLQEVAERSGKNSSMIRMVQKASLL
jgi:8-oxo-dGTP pyrophosphatase MutT (NUDIX family)